MVCALLTGVLFFVPPDFGKANFWHVNYASALEDVRRTDRPLFVVFETGSTSLERVMGVRPYLNDRVEEALAADYVRMLVDVETDSGRALADQFGATELPRVVVVDRSGNWQVYRKSGVHSPDQVLSVLTRYRLSKIAASPTTSLEEPRFMPPGGSAGTLQWCRT